MMTETDPEYHSPAPNSYQVNGDHYQGELMQPWDVIALCGFDYFLGNVTKYILRYDRKGEAYEDLKKAAHYIAKFQSLHHTQQQKRISNIGTSSGSCVIAIEKATTDDEAGKREMLLVLLKKTANKQAMDTLRHDLLILAEQYAPTDE